MIDFIKSNNQTSWHNEESINFFSNLLLNAPNKSVIDLFISIFTAPQNCREKYFNKLKNYYQTINMDMGTDFDSNVENFMKIRFQNAKGAFFEILTYILINNYCNYDKVFKETYIKYNGNLSNHPFDIIVVNHNVNLLELKFSCRFLKINQLNNLVEFNNDKIKCYLGSFDDSLKIKMKFKYLSKNSNLSSKKFNKLYSKINIISKNEFYNSILNNKCIFDDSFNLVI